ncbi:hypothetical protein FACS189462_1670 [Spirochaetia bacterium]|nr:hypothetical protein FACS189462_1670 [Spirochaetia bacterium]
MEVLDPKHMNILGLDRGRRQNIKAGFRERGRLVCNFDDRLKDWLRNGLRRRGGPEQRRPSKKAPGTGNGFRFSIAHG